MQTRPGRSRGSKDDSEDGGPPAKDGSSVDPHELAGLGIGMGLAIALFALGGNWLDGRLGTRPLFVLLGVFLGFGGGFLSIYSRLMGRGGSEEERGSRED